MMQTPIWMAQCPCMCSYRRSTPFFVLTEWGREKKVAKFCPGRPSVYGRPGWVVFSPLLAPNFFLVAYLGAHFSADVWGGGGGARGKGANLISYLPGSDLRPLLLGPFPPLYLRIVCLSSGKRAVTRVLTVATFFCEYLDGESQV